MTTYYKLDHSEPGYLSQMLPRADGTWVKRADYYADFAAARAEIERLTKERDEARAQVAAALAHPPQPSVSVSCPAPTPDDETYYSKGKDANWLAALSDEDLAEAVCFAAQDLNDTGLGDDLDKWMPFQAMMSIAADRINKLITAQPSVSDAQSALEAYGREKVREGMQRAAEVARECWNDPPCEADAEYIPNAILAEMETLK